MLFIEEKGKMEAIYYIDAWGQYFDEVSGKQLDPKGVVKARIEEMVEVCVCVCVCVWLSLQVSPR